jgi:hypothetical protein
MSSSPRTERQRRIGLVLLVLVVALFVVELVALVLGLFVLAVACAAVFTVAWFVMRSMLRDRQRAPRRR